MPSSINCTRALLYWVGALCLFSFSACSQEQAIQFIHVLPDPQAAEVHFDLGRGQKTPHQLKVQVNLGNFKTQSVNDPSDVASLKLYVLDDGISGIMQPITNGGPFPLTVSPALNGFFPQIKTVIFDNVPGPSSATYLVAAAAFDSSGTNITGSGTQQTGSVQIDEDGGGCPCEDAFFSIGGGRYNPSSNEDEGDVQIFTPPNHDLAPGHEPPLLIFMTLD